MESYAIGNYPNQQFSVQVNGVFVTFRLRTFRDITYASVTINDEEEPAAGSIRCTPNEWLLNAELKRRVGGNFKFVTAENEYPHYTKFNTEDCKFVFCNLDEIEE